MRRDLSPGALASEVASILQKMGHGPILEFRQTPFSVLLFSVDSVYKVRHFSDQVQLARAIHGGRRDTPDPNGLSLLELERGRRFNTFAYRRVHQILVSGLPVVVIAMRRYPDCASVSLKSGEWWASVGEKTMVRWQQQHWSGRRMPVDSLDATRRLMAFIASAIDTSMGSIRLLRSRLELLPELEGQMALRDGRSCGIEVHGDLNPGNLFFIDGDFHAIDPAVAAAHMYLVDSMVALADATVDLIAAVGSFDPVERVLQHLIASGLLREEDYSRELVRFQLRLRSMLRVVMVGLREGPEVAMRNHEKYVRIATHG